MDTTQVSRHAGSDYSEYELLFMFLSEQELPRAIVEIIADSGHCANDDSLLWDSLAYACSQRLIGVKRFKIATLMGKFIALNGSSLDSHRFAQTTQRKLSHVSCRFLTCQELKMLAAYALVRSCNSVDQREYGG